MMPQAAQSAAEDVVVINDDVWEQIIELTGGAAAPCYQCGVCTATCPWGLVTHETISVRVLLRQAQLGLALGSDSLWLCTTCAQCEAYCPRGVSIVDVFRGLRSMAWERRQIPHGLPSLLWSVYWNNNPWSQPPSQRSAWARSLDLPTFDPARHEILFYVGCTSAYDGRARKVARSLAHLLDAAGVAFGVLGEDEPCCGEAVLSAGHIPYFEDVARHTAHLFQRRGITRLVTISPHCYDVFKNHYPRLGEGFRPLHYTQYLSTLIEEKRLRLDRPVQLKVTFHDPCYLARHNGECEAPRRILQAIPGVALIEMSHAGTDTLCCGGGGGRMWMETAAGERLANLRVEDARATGAEVLATACPFCIACLEDSLKARQAKDMAVMDVAEIAARALAGKGSASDEEADAEPI